MNKLTLVLGASLKSNRYSNLAIQRLITSGHDVLAYGSKKGIVNGVTIENKLINFIDVDTITLYLNPLRQKEYYDYIISLNPKRVIFNPGTENFELYKLLKEHNIEFEVACTLTLLATNQY